MGTVRYQNMAHSSYPPSPLIGSPAQTFQTTSKTKSSLSIIHMQPSILLISVSLAQDDHLVLIVRYSMLVPWPLASNGRSTQALALHWAWYWTLQTGTAYKAKLVKSPTPGQAFFPVAWAAPPHPLPERPRRDVYWQCPAESQTAPSPKRPAWGDWDWLASSFASAPGCTSPRSMRSWTAPAPWPRQWGLLGPPCRYRRRSASVSWFAQLGNASWFLEAFQTLCPCVMRRMFSNWWCSCRTVRVDVIFVFFGRFTRNFRFVISLSQITWRVFMLSVLSKFGDKPVLNKNCRRKLRLSFVGTKWQQECAETGGPRDTKLFWGMIRVWLVSIDFWHREEHNDMVKFWIACLSA